MDTAVWVGTAFAALALAVAAPKGLAILGHLPAFTAANLNKESVMIPEGLKAERTLLLLSLQRGQGHDIDSWIMGMHLREDSSLPWLRMPVRDESAGSYRSEVEGRLLARFTEPTERANVVPVFTDRDAFLKSAGLSRNDAVYALVVNRRGDVLARAEGPFDAEKARVLRDTLLVERRL
jgi:hypothetical protein